MLKALTLALMLMALPATAAECVYRDGVEGTEAIETSAGYDVTFQGEVIDHCRISTKDDAPWADCDEGWDGWIVYAGAAIDDPTDGAIMVLSNTVYYRVCT